MAVITAYLIRWAAGTKTPLRASAVVFLFLMMVAMFVGLAIYFAEPGISSAIEGLWMASALMSVSVVLVFLGLRAELRQRVEVEKSGGTVVLQNRRLFVLAVVLLVIANELLMGWTFQRAAGGPLWLGDGGVGDLFAGLLINPWFVLPMALEMACALFWLRGDLPRIMIVLLAFQPIVMFSSPPSLSSSVWAIATAAISSAAMAAAVGYLVFRLYHGAAVSGTILVYALALFVSFGVMAAGLASWALTGATGLYAAAVVCQMVIFLLALLSPARFQRFQEDDVARGKVSSPNLAGGAGS